MENKLKDYNNYDNITIYATNNKAKILISSYEKLGWILVSSTSNNRYSNIIDLNFVRPHKIPNKDKLQLLQVNMEITYNDIGKLEKTKNSKTIISYLTFIIMGIIFLSCGFYFCFQQIKTFQKILAIMSILMGVFLIFLSIIISPKIHKKEKIFYNKKLEELNNKLTLIFQEIEKYCEA